MLRVATALLGGLIATATVSAATTAEPISVSLNTRPAAVAEHSATVLFTVRIGRRPLAGVRPRAWVRGPLGIRTSRAAAAGKPGRYRARIAFPGGGSWTLGVTVGRRSFRLATVDVRGAGPPIAAPHGIAVAEEHGDLIVADRAGDAFYEVNLRTLKRTRVGGGFVHPFHLDFGPSGHLYVLDDRRVWRFEPEGTLTPFAGNGARGLAGDGGPATAAQLGGPGEFAFDSAGSLYIPEYDNGVRLVTPDGRIDTLGGIGREGYSGDGGPARSAAFGAPHGLDVLPDGSLLVADSHNGVIRRIDGSTRVVTTFASGFSAPVSIDARLDGSAYVADARLDHIVRIAADGSRTRLGRGLATPVVVAADHAGNVYVSEFETHRVRRIDGRTGRTTTIVGR
jgi:DNA-binding beta-propeller fold protein YncE